jgi:co-chaperonin GroES (HSP10)
MKAINNYLVVEKIKEGMKDVGGLLLTDKLDSDNRYLKAKIISTGNLVEGLQDGEIVYYDRHAGHGISYKDKLYQVIRSQDVVLVE